MLAEARLPRNELWVAGLLAGGLVLVVWRDAVYPVGSPAAWAGWVAYSVAIAGYVGMGLPWFRQWVGEGWRMVGLAATLSGVATCCASILGRVTVGGLLEAWAFLFGLVGLGFLCRRWRSVERRFGWMDFMLLPLAALPVVFHLVPMWQVPPWPGTPVPPVGPAYIVLLLAVPLALGALLLTPRQPRLEFGWAVRGGDLLTALALYGAFLLVGVPVGLWTGLAAHHPCPWDMWQGIGAFCSLFFFPAVLEEFFFRGICLNLMAERWGLGWAVLLSSLLFGLLHLRKPHPFAYAGLAVGAGAVYGAVYLRTGNLTAAALTHALVDFTWLAWFGG
ncbi:MAG TPA: CPBP family intramembrane glutamic endopeptidase [Candidatus Xenobia bacterium]|jgi:membrane protease YdiL (CAAX protease family)